MNILVTLDHNYLGPLKVMLGSMFFNNPEETFDIYMIADGVSQEEEQVLQEYCIQHRHNLHRIYVTAGFTGHDEKSQIVL